jgi:hypothetical protein
MPRRFDSGRETKCIIDVKSSEQTTQVGYFLSISQATKVRLGGKGIKLLCFASFVVGFIALKTGTT